MAVAEAEARAGAAATALPALASTKREDVATGRVRAAVRPLAAQQNSRTVLLHLRAARARWEKVKGKKFVVGLQKIYRRFEAMGVGRWARIQQSRKGQVKNWRQTARADGKKKKKPFTAADAHERGKEAAPVVPMTALGMLNSEGWAKGNGVGMAVYKASFGNEMAAWGHSFPADEKGGDGRYTDKNSARFRRS